jgi:biotin carboxylase
MTRQNEATSARRLAVVYDPGAVSPLKLAEAANGTWRPIWLIDRDEPSQLRRERALRKFGEVVHASRHDLAAACRTVAACKPDGLVAFSEDCLVWASEIAHEVGLPFYDPPTAMRLTNKHRQREALHKAGIAVPRHWSIPLQQEPHDWAKAAEEVRYPAVLKPESGSGSSNTYRLADSRALAEILTRHREDKVGWVIEEYIPDGVPRKEQIYGDYVSVESVVAHGLVSHVAVTGRLPLEEPFRESGFFIPSTLGSAQIEAVTTLAAEAAMALGVDAGCLHTEIKLTPDGPRVIEVNGRLGGGIPEMLSLASGASLFNIAGRVALGEHVRFRQLAPCHQIGYLFYVQAPTHARMLERIENLEAVRAMPGVEDVFLNRRPGQGLDWRDGNHGYLYSVLGSTRDHQHMLDTRKNITEAVNVIVS